MKKHKYVFKKYNKDFPLIYQDEEKRIKRFVMKNARVEHVGSSSVQELGGKGIIDVAILVPKKDVMKNLKTLVWGKYKYNPKHPGDEIRKIFLRKRVFKGKKYLVHVHLMSDENFFNNYLVFRDYLRKNEKERKSYEKLKKEGVKIAKGNGRNYYAHKRDFMKSVLFKALGRKE